MSLLSAVPFPRKSNVSSEVVARAAVSFYTCAREPTRFYASALYAQFEGLHAIDRPVPLMFYLSPPYYVGCMLEVEGRS